MTYQGQSYVPLRNMRDNRNEKSLQTSYWPLKSEADIAKEGNSKGDIGSESTELWSAIKNVKDYVWSSGSQLIGTIKGLCKTPRSEWKSSRTDLQLLNNPTQFPMGGLLKNETARDVSMLGWHKSLGEKDETTSWIKNMMSDPDVSGETKFNICRMVELDNMGQSGVVPPFFFSSQQRLLPSRSLTPTSRHSFSGSRQISPRKSLYEGTRSFSGLPPLLPRRRLSGRAMTPYTQEKSPYHSQAWSTSRVSSRRGSANFSGVGSPFSVPYTEMKLRSRPLREFGLSPRENQRSMVTYSDPTIARALANYRRGRTTYTKEDFDKYNRAKRSQFVGYRSRLKTSATKKSEQKKRKSFVNHGEPFRTSSAKRSRSGEKKDDKRSSIIMDIDSINNCFEPDTCSTATTLTQPIANDDSMRSTTSSKDDEVKNRESRMSNDSASQDSVFTTAKSGVTTNFFSSIPSRAVGSDGTNLTGGLFGTSPSINPVQLTSKTNLVTSKAKDLASTAPKGKPSTANLFGSTKSGLFHTKATAKPVTSILANRTIPKKDHKTLDKTLSTKPIADTDPGGKMEIPVKTAPSDKKPVEHVSYVCRMAQMRRIKIKEHYTQQIEKLYDFHCKDKDKDTKKKNAVQTYQNKYHKRRQDHMFYTKLCDKYKVKPGDEYDGNDPDIKPDVDKEDEEKLPHATKQPEENPTPLLFGIPAGTNDKSAVNINPFANNPFAVKEPAKSGGFNFSGGNLFNQTSSPGKGLFSQHSAKSSNGQLKASNLFSGKVISSTPSVSLFGKPILKQQKPSAFTFDATKPTNLESKATAPKKESVDQIFRVRANEIFRGCDKNSLWTHHLEGTMPNSEDDNQPKKDDETTSKALLFGLSSSSGANQTSLFGGKAPEGNMFGGDSNTTITIAKPLSTPSDLFSNPVKSSDTGGMFGISAAKTNGGSSNNNSGGLFSGTAVTGKNMFDVKSGSSSNPFANCSSGVSPATKNIFATNTNYKGPASLFSPNSQVSPNNLFSPAGNGMFGSNSNRFNINNKPEKSFSFGTVDSKSNTNGKRRRIVRGRRTMK